MAQKRGIAVISEVTLTAGILVIAVVTFLITGNVTESEGETFSREQQNELLTDLTDRLERVALENQAFTSLVYNPSLRQYKIVVENNSVLTVKIPGVDRGRLQLQSVEVENTVIQDDDTLCISGSNGEAKITAGACSRIDMATFCANNRCIDGTCQINRGETCESPDCSCPSSAGTAEANTTCQPSYIPESYIEGSGDTVDPGCVVDGRTWVQDEEQRCDFDFECKKNLQCSKTSDADEERCCTEEKIWNGTQCEEIAKERGETCTSTAECRDDLQCREPAPGTSGDTRCCPGGENWNGTQCVAVDYIRLAFIPLASNSGFDSSVTNHVDFFKQNYPINSCPSKVKVESLSSTCDIETFDSFTECTAERTNYEYKTYSSPTAYTTYVLDRIEDCLSGTGISYDYAIGVFAEDVCGGVAGWSDGSGGTPSVAVEGSTTSNTEVVTSHEIGHEYGLNEEYFDTCRCGIKPVSPSDSNCLRTANNGDDPIAPDYTGYCGGGSFCQNGVNDPENLGDSQPTCLGNTRMVDGVEKRAIMGPAGLGVPRAFGPESWEYLNNIEELQCP